MFRHGFTGSRMLLHLTLMLVSFLFLVPMLYVVSTAVKAPGETYINPGLIPHSFDLGKFPKVWSQVRLLQLGLNSIVITTATVLLVLISGSLAGYAFSRLQFLGKDLLLLVFLAGLMIPFACLISPMYVLTKALGLFNTYGAVVGPYVAFGVPFCILLVRSYFDTLPREIEESASIDGASSLVIYAKIAVPLAKPALATVAIFQALASWNEFLLALLFLTSARMRTLPLGLMVFRRMYEDKYEYMCALLLTITVPVVVLFLVLQKQFVAGLTSGAIRGG